jgi:1,4-dihydroxy-2-naphthoate octaprenyltransferase
VNIAMPLVYGQALAYATRGAFSWRWAAVIAAYGVLNHLFIVFANDYADRDTDALQTEPTPFSGGSRVLPEGKLTAPDLLHAAWIAWTLMVVLAAGSAWLGHRWWAVPLVGAASVLLHAYSFRPLRLSYRGFGEWLQGLGLGIVLPAMAFVLQAGDMQRIPWLALAPTVLLGMAGNITTALPDVTADRQAQKRTLPVRRGELRARITTILLIALPATVPLRGHGDMPQLWFVGGSVVAALCLLANVATIKQADVAHRAACLRFVVLNAAAINALYIGWTVALIVRGPLHP